MSDVMSQNIEVLPGPCSACGSTETATVVSPGGPHVVCHACGRSAPVEAGLVMFEFEGFSPITVTATNGTQYSPGRASIEAVLPEQGVHVEISVYGPSSRFGRPVGAEVNWPGVGAVPAIDAFVMATLLRFASLVAVALERGAR